MSQLSDLTVVVPCVGYSDFLRLTLSTLPGTVLVLTSSTDTSTQLLCDERGVRCITTNSWWAAGSQFNKAAALNHGLSLVETPWVCCLDADIYIPFDLLGIICSLDRRNLYSCRRLLCADPAALPHWLAGAATLKEDGLCERLNCPQAGNNFAGLLGYMQLWNLELYDDRFGDYYQDASIYDVAFGLRWRHRRSWIQEPVVHLGKTGTNWKGLAPKSI